MHSNTNILQNGDNIESYLNLGDRPVSQPSPIFPVLAEPHHEGIFSSLMESQILLCKGDSIFNPPASTLASEVDSVSQKKSAKEATAKYRERRKMYQQELEASVRSLQQEIQKTDAEIKKTKDAVLVKLESSVKAASHSAQNAQIYLELDTCLPKIGEDQQMADIDKINLLLNTLKYRIGPSGRERHAKIEYNFKNIVNTLFPGLLRYFLITASKNTDMFAGQADRKMEWTAELLKKMNLSKYQQEKIKQFEGKLKEMHEGTLNKILRLQIIKRKMKEQSLMADTAQDQMRQRMNATQCARLTMFAQKYKYRKQISLDEKFKPKKCGTMIEEEMEELLQHQLGRKKVHLDPQFRV